MIESLINQIVKHLDVPSEDVKPESELRELMTDSLEFIEFIIFIEHEYDIALSDKDIGFLVLVKDLSAFIENFHKPSPSV